MLKDDISGILLDLTPRRRQVVRHHVRHHTDLEARNITLPGRHRKAVSWQTHYPHP